MTGHTVKNLKVEDHYLKGYTDGHRHGRKYVAFQLDVTWPADQQEGYREGYRQGRRAAENILPAKEETRT